MQSSPSKGKGKLDVKAELSDVGMGDVVKNELAEKDDLDDVLWETTCGDSKMELDGDMKMDLEPIGDIFTGELLDFQLEEPETKEANKNVGYIEDSIAEKIICYIEKLCKHVTVCSDILETYPPSQQPNLYKVLYYYMLVVYYITIALRLLALPADTSCPHESPFGRLPLVYLSSININISEHSYMKFSEKWNYFEIKVDDDVIIQ